jgi:hypothetical protein
MREGGGRCSSRSKISTSRAFRTSHSEVIIQCDQSLLFIFAIIIIIIIIAVMLS